MNARTVVEHALRAMVAQDIREHMRWIDDDVALDSSVPLPRSGKLRYLQECSPVLAAGTGIRLLGYEISEVAHAEGDEQWVGAILTLEAPKNGRPLPDGPDRVRGSTIRSALHRPW